MRGVCPGLDDTVENLSRESCKGGFLWSFREQMTGFHGLLRQNPTSLFILLGWSSISTSNIWVWWRGCWCYEAGCGAPSWGCVLPQLTYLDIPVRYTDGAPSTWCRLNSLSVQCSLGHTHMGILYTPGILRPRSSLTSQRKLYILLSGIPTNLTAPC
jgi:hypothetical protein